MTLYLEVFVRFVAIGMLVGLSVLMLRASLKKSAARYAFLLNIAMISLLLITGTPPWSLQGPSWMLLSVFSTLIFPVAWLFGLALFEEDFRIGAREQIVLLVYAIPPAFFAAWYFGFDPPWLEGVRISWLLMSLGLMIHVAYRALAGRSDDLVEARRRERVRVAIAIALLLVFIFAAFEVFNAFGDTKNWRYLVLLALPYSIWMSLWLARAHPEALAFVPIIQVEPKPASIAPRDAAMKSRLDALMEEEHFYREQGLTIRTLAEKVGVPEHQLRALINGAMNYRNFAMFLNHYRIKDAKTALSAPENARAPVLKIAMDVGYSSVTPFNSAFKAKTGKTPTQFRTEALSQISQN